jgi:hypothetical protein
MTDRFTAIIARPVRPSTPLDIQASWLRYEALEAMGNLGEVDPDSLRLDAVSADATLRIGGVSTGVPGAIPMGAELISLWQLNMFAALFVADGKATTLDSDYVGEKDYQKGRFGTARVERGLA